MMHGRKNIKLFLLCFINFIYDLYMFQTSPGWNPAYQTVSYTE